MDLMKGDMGGAAVVLSTIWAISQLNLPVNVVASIPLCENMPAGNGKIDTYYFIKNYVKLLNLAMWLLEGMGLVLR